ncbi:proteoglycan 4-like isoform X1 [Anopheles arabiensis]|uniref:ZAD domain-containing protein n=2 Tax=Anopheles arabiensis TaxID=7173 RepID=A0A182IBV0_ANOAR|nr:proteoglycan 4-like isoform X1 [Anopheles arabiensis]
MDSNSLLSMNLALNVARKCRICGMDILDLTCAFPIFGNDRVDQKLERYLQLNIQIDDLLPKCICGSCYLKLESIDQFALMASRTEEAFRAWLGRLRGLNSPAEAAKNVNVMLPLFRLDPDGGADSKKGHNASAAKDARSNPSPTVSTATPPASVSPPEKGIISYSDLKLGLLIKDQELLKLILKALRWAENDRRASFEVLIQRLKNSSFREILSNRNLLNDSDLTQLLKSYIGQGVMNSFAAMPPSAASTPLNNNNVVPPAVMFQPPINPTGGVKSGNQSGFVAPVGPIAGVNVNEYRIDEASVTQMEVGVDPDLYLPYEDEDSSSTNKFEGTRIEDRQENTVTIKLVTTNVAGDMIENKRMIPAILNVRGTKRFQCSACPECFETNGELQQHIVRRHLPRTNRTVITEQGKPAIKIRVRKNKPIAGPLLPPKLIPPSAPITLTATTPSPTVPTRDSGGVTVARSSSPIKIVPLKIPASTTITVIPATPPPTTMVPVEPIKPPTVEQKVEVKPPPIKKEPPSAPASPAKGELLVRKSKRKTSLKPEVSSLILEKQQKKRKVQKVVQKPVQKEAQTPPAPPAPPAPPSPKPKTSRKSNAFCALCRKRLTPKQTMRVHMQQEHSRYECEKCDRAFKSALNLSRHQQYHASSSSTVPTELASSSASTKRVQKAANPPPPPQQEEEKEQTHKCSYCEKAFKRSHHLKLHLKHHKKDVTSAGSGLRRRAKLNQSSSSGSSGSAIKSVLVSSTAESGQGSKARKMEATKRKSTITRKVRFSC